MAAVTTGILLTAQRTPEVGRLLAALQAEGHREVRASSPPFNKGLEGAELAHYNVPAFGAAIPRAAAELSRAVGVPYPEGIDGFVLTKVDDIEMLAQGCDLVGAPAPAAHLRAFVAAVKALDVIQIRSAGDWHQFVCAQGVPEDWILRLHFDHVTQLFGVTDAQLAELRALRVAKEAGPDGAKLNRLVDAMYEGPGELKALQDHSMSWLSKVLCLWRVNGCPTDIVNAVFAMSGPPPEAPPTEAEILAKINAMRELVALKAAPWWVPGIVIHDAERDDRGTAALVAHVRAYMGVPPARVCVQLPPVESEVDLGKGKIVRADFSALAEELRREGAEVFHDPDSRNAKALYQH